MTSGVSSMKYGLKTLEQKSKELLMRLQGESLEEGGMSQLKQLLISDGNTVTSKTISMHTVGERQKLKLMNQTSQLREAITSRNNMKVPSIPSMSGRKTYAIAVVSVAWALVGLGMGWLESDLAIQMIQAALLASGIRHGIK